jgi:hypothetical protein
MYTKQVSVFLENKKGRLAEVTKILREEGINLRALQLADTVDFGVLRLIVDDRPRCMRVLRERELAAQETDVIAVEIEDRPGGLDRIVQVLNDRDVNIEYMYTFLGRKGDRAIVIFKCEDPAAAAKALAGADIAILPEDTIQNL